MTCHCAQCRRREPSPAHRAVKPAHTFRFRCVETATPSGTLRDVTLPSCTYVRSAEAGYRNPVAGHEPVREVGPTAEALDALDRATTGARLVRRTGPTSYVVVG